MFHIWREIFTLLAMFLVGLVGGYCIGFESGKEDAIAQRLEDLEHDEAIKRKA